MIDTGRCVNHVCASEARLNRSLRKRLLLYMAASIAGARLSHVRMG